MRIHTCTSKFQYGSRNDVERKNNYKVNQHCLKSNREDAYIVQCTAITPTQCTRILKITLHVHKAALIKNKTLYDEIKLLFQANFHLHHNCAKNTRKLG